MVATVKRCERVYKRTDEPSELFCERGGTVQRVIDFLNKKIGTSETCSDVVEMGGIEPPSEEASPQGATSVVCD